MSENITNSARPKVLIVDDIPANLKMLQDILEPQGYQIFGAADGEAALKIAAGVTPDVVLLDIVMPGMDGYEVCRRLKQNPATQQIPVIFVTAKDDEQNRNEEVCLRVKTHLEIAQLTLALQAQNRALSEEIVRHKQTELARQQAEERFTLISQQEAQRWGIDGFIGQSKRIQKILSEVRQLQHAGTTSVLITGESGTGKELIARAIHSGGTRAQSPFIPLNCSAILHELAESILFGHVRGAFTGANTDVKGHFELADGAPYSSTKSAICPLGYKPSSCASSKMAALCRLALLAKSVSMSASSPPPTPISSEKLPKGPSGETSTIGSLDSPLPCHRYASERKIFPYWLGGVDELPLPRQYPRIEKHHRRCPDFK
ncbi:sigma-54-dependent Fis family transcriptional regulator [Candidatus Poribacteria bacterium]|nr:sigma-54-dependent Fis family transcriptional regulator [Candidatus Poribacteria bacterium]